MIHVEDKGPDRRGQGSAGPGKFPTPGISPSAENRSALRVNDTFGTPGTREVLDSSSRRDMVFLIGTGQTTVDFPQRRGLIRPGPAHLGVDALLNGAVMGQNGAASDVLYTLGSSMKGVLWEVLAVPEIRVQAERLARLLLDGDDRRRDASSPHAR